ncbi:phosphoribosylaminoimidazolesuccinocarboxamide synthase [Rothia mucilaginosa]|uniref:phosphoribosylaminoimidazolesuccinocarboxamide synthase n=1 Tax=Rothia mucilaginosa TaxID=43675 RepID=UPI001CAA9CA6|nr:phosphoribosylaminoimidazolesuccinocarboxamide synthase [Rothia mucilaginosa]MBF1678761.1 phosphoribosylaminoimidazolesuccinocarboxamide synthase [Rothia sp. (in: high G+C Gram-positive bacteria)]
MTSRSNPVEIPGWTHIYSGKVRDLYVPNEERFDATGLTVNDDAELRAGSVMVVASDRISAFDRILPTEIPDKGKILTQMSLWWFEQLKQVPNHVLSTDVPDVVAGRAMICRSLNMFPVECIVRGYLTGSGLAAYNETGEIAGVKLPAGLVDGSRLDTPIFTPTGKAEVGEHDELVTREELYAEVGQPVGERLEELSLSLYTTAEKIAREQGIILADTKMEFGTDSYRGEITLGDEVLTPDSSRFWDATQYEPGRAQPSFDKQYVRDWLRSPESGWDGSDNVPHLPEEVVEKTRARYVEAYERLTGTKF